MANILGVVDENAETQDKITQLYILREHGILYYIMYRGKDG